MVRSLHDAGIEVILDVVYNHTAEGNHLGPTLSFKGIDNEAYYRLVDDDRQHYMDYTGTGNSLNVRHPHSLQLIMDSLRYWVLEMHVDGFRFDLASTLAREFYDVDKLSTFFELVQQDPTISQVKLIAEPWDVGPGGYQVGNFPPQWTEWNGKYRDTVRDFWRGEPATLGEFASRFTGSADLYEHDGRRPVASINFVTAHDGFTLADLVSYNEKHNDANGEDNNDGESHNRSWNCGVEGPTDDPAIQTLRARQQRNFLATLLLSQGVPMILHGDELGRTQHGNNNTYAQDSELSWVHWDRADTPLIEFIAGVARLRKQHPTFRRARFFDGRPVRRGEGEPLPDIVWLTPDGGEMVPEDWDAGFGRAIGVFLNGDGIRGRDARGERITDLNFLIYFNAHDDSRRLHAARRGVRGAVGDRRRHRRRRRRQRTREGRARPSRWRPRRSSSSAPTPRRTSSPTTRSPHRWRPIAGAVTPSAAAAAIDGRLMRVPSRRTDCRSARSSTSHDAAAVADYVHDLGADWLYLSPILKAERGLGPRLRRRRPLDGRSGARRRRGAGRGGQGGAASSASGCSSTSCPTTSAWPRRWRASGGGTCSPTVVRRATPRRSTSTGSSAAARCGSRCSATSTSPTLRVADGELRYHDHRFPLAPGSADDGASPAEVHARQHYELDQLAARRRRAELPPVLRRQHAGRHPGRGPVGVRRVARRDRALDPGRHRRRSAGRPPGRAGRSRRLPRRPRRGDRRRLRARREDPRRRRAAAAIVGGGRHHRLRRARRHRPRAGRSERPAGARRARHAAARRRRAGVVGGAHPRHEARDRRRHPAGGGAPPGTRHRRVGTGRRDGTECADRRCRRRAARLLPRVPLVPPARARAPRTRRPHSAKVHRPELAATIDARRRACSPTPSIRRASGSSRRRAW